MTLDEFAEAQRDLLEETLAGEEIHAADLVVIAVVNRSLALTRGMAQALKTRNAIVAAPILRMQIDSILRLYALWCVDDHKDVLDALYADKPFRCLTDREGNQLTDRHLYESVAALGDDYAWIPDVYRATSGMVHLSGRHILSACDSAGERGATFRVPLEGASHGWNHLEIMKAFEAATSNLMHLVYSWKCTKYRQVDGQ